MRSDSTAADRWIVPHFSANCPMQDARRLGSWLASCIPGEQRMRDPWLRENRIPCSLNSQTANHHGVLLQQRKRNACGIQSTDLLDKSLCLTLCFLFAWRLDGLPVLCPARWAWQVPERARYHQESVSNSTKALLGLDFGRILGVE